MQIKKCLDRVNGQMAVQGDRVASWGQRMRWGAHCIDANYVTETAVPKVPKKKMRQRPEDRDTVPINSAQYA